jgi:gluconokinase
MNDRYVIGLDIGTTSTKAVLFHYDGAVIGELEVEYPILRPQADWAEQDPDEIVNASKQAIRLLMERTSVSPSAVTAVGISSAMHSIICLNEDKQPLSNAIIWADTRSSEQAAQLRLSLSSQFMKRTGTPFHPMTPFCKLTWMKQKKYPPFIEASSFASIKEYLCLLWFDEHVVDYATASSYGMFDIDACVWDVEALQLLQLSSEQFGKPVPPTYTLYGMSAALADELGLLPSTPFVVGATDGPLANLGVGATGEGDTVITIGTSGAIRQLSYRPMVDEHQRTFCYRVDDHLFVSGGATNNGGIVLHWLQKLFAINGLEKNASFTPSYDSLLRLAEQSPAGANGVLFLPYLNGERAPIWDGAARASFVGLGMSHHQPDMIRAALEGTIFSLYHVGQTLKEMSGRPTRLFANGGFSRSKLWLQIAADMFNQELLLPKSHQSAAWGAAWYSLYALGEVPSLAAIKNSVPMTNSILPVTEHSLVYEKNFTFYEKLATSLPMLRK